MAQEHNLSYCIRCKECTADNPEISALCGNRCEDCPCPFCLSAQQRGAVVMPVRYPYRCTITSCEKEFDRCVFYKSDPEWVAEVRCSCCDIPIEIVLDKLEEIP